MAIQDHEERVLMPAFPRTNIGGVSVSRLVVGTNWFLGYSHTSLAKDDFIRNYQSRERIAEVLAVFLESGVDTVIGPTHPLLIEGIHEAEQRTGQKIILALTPIFETGLGAAGEGDAEAVISNCKQMGATFCMPHQQVTDALLDRSTRQIRDIERITALIRQYEMVPGLSTHLPETVTFCDERNYDIETYLQIYNSAGFMMPLEVDWEMRIILDAHKPVWTIKPLAAGRLIPLVGLCFVWNTLRPQDLVTIGTTSPGEAREVIDMSLDFIEHRIPDNRLQVTRSKAIFDKQYRSWLEEQAH
jgi:hypothetical protein